MSTSRDHRRQLYEQLVGKPVAGGRFRISKLLGFGGMGAVYEALQLNMNRPVALKLIPTHDPTTVARFEREALTISQLRHPNTITVFDYGRTEEGFLFLSMELLEGRTLSDVVKASGPLPPRQAVHIASQICRSLNEAHHAGIVHRDIKPDNIILIRVDADDSFVKVLDFGIAKAVMGEDDVQLTGDGRIIGTPRYMSPEQILAESLDHRSDIYSLGCIIFEMLTGAPPFQQSSTTALMISHTQDPPPAFAQRLSPPSLEKIPPYLEGVVRRALAKDPNDRPQTTEELRIELEQAMNAVPVGQSQQYLAAMPSASHSGLHTASSTASQSGLLAAPVNTGNFANPHPITGTFNPPMQTGQSVVLPAPVVEEPAKSNSKLVMVAVLVLLLMVGGVALFFGTRSAKPDGAPTPDPAVADVKPEPDVAKTPTEEPPVSAPSFVSVEVSTTPAGAKIFRNGVDANKVTPAMVALEVGKPVDVRFELAGFRPYEAEIVPAKGSRVVATLVPERSEKTRVTDAKDKGVRVKTPEVATKKDEPVEPVVEPVEQTPKVNRLDDEEKAKVDRLD